MEAGDEECRLMSSIAVHRGLIVSSSEHLVQGHVGELLDHREIHQ